ncbi:hypothetical protein ACFWA5_44880 [Streptomyces mirabilis]|uniref:terpene synthase family protein n=1 Tax=Streptomyces mirabilis TaxID=68239 RepID=UPI00366A4C0A
MPTDVDLPLPFTAPQLVPAALEQARRRSVRWATVHGLLQPSEAAIDSFLTMGLAEVSAGFSPKAGGPDLDVMTDVVTWTAVCDDFFDGAEKDDPAVTAAAVSALASVTGSVTGSDGIRALRAAPADVEALAGATADLWTRMRALMSPQWRARAGHNWRCFLHSFLVEANARRAGTVPVLADYLVLRRETTAMYVYLDAAERTGRYEVPERVLADPVLRRLGLLQTDTIVHCGDVHSVEHAEALGDTHNLVFVLERGTGRPRTEVIGEIRGRIRVLAGEFQHTVDAIPALYDRLACNPVERVSTERHIRAMTRQLRVTYDWSFNTRGFTAPDPSRRRPDHVAADTAHTGTRMLAGIGGPH